MKPSPTGQCFEDIALAPGSGTAFCNDFDSRPMQHASEDIALIPGSGTTISNARCQMKTISENFSSRSPGDSSVITILFNSALFQSHHEQNIAVLSQSHLKWRVRQCDDHCPQSKVKSKWHSDHQCAVLLSRPTVKLKFQTTILPWLRLLEDKFKKRSV